MGFRDFGVRQRLCRDIVALRGLDIERVRGGVAIDDTCISNRADVIVAVPAQAAWVRLDGRPCAEVTAGDEC